MAAAWAVGRLEVFPLAGFPEVTKGADLAGLVMASLKATRVSLKNNDVLVVKHKIVSKSEGRVVSLDGVVPGSRAKELAQNERKDPRLVELMLREAVRVVRAGHGVIITETTQGFVCANSGVDQSNVGRGLVALLPKNPDLSARRLRRALEKASGLKIAVVVSDTFGRPWRLGQTDVAIGCSGIDPLMKYFGRKDRFGYSLRVTEPSVADEIAGAAELVIGKLNQIPAALVRGIAYTRGDSGVRSMILPPEMDLFR
jgi:coenzyme F420-0:L-glutamate ligase / coenzyme F420-1:gamma-L-glutamate ligase